MTCYDKRDLRAADLLALLLCGLGVALYFLASLPLLFEKVPRLADGGLSLCLGGTLLVALGGILNLKVRELIRNGGREPGDYPGVPE